MPLIRFGPFQPIAATLRENRYWIAAGLISLLLVDVAQLLIPRVIKSVVDLLTRGVLVDGALERCGIIVLGLAVCIAFFRFVWRYCIIGTSRRIERDLRDRLFSHIIRLPQKTLSGIPTGDLMARMTNDLEAVRMCAGIGLIAFVDTIFLGLAAFGFMMYISPLLSLVCLAPMAGIMLITRGLSKKVHRRFGRVQAAFATLTEKVRESLSGIAVIKAYCMEGHAAADFQTLSQQYVGKNLDLIKIMSLFFPLIMLFSNLSICILIFHGGNLTIHARITPGDFVAFASYLWILTWPMMALGWVVNLYQRGTASMLRINDLLNRGVEPGTASHALPRPEPEPAGDLCIRDLSFSYNTESAPALSTVTLHARPGQTIGITGKTGSGKSTLCRLLLRLHDVPAGAITWGGRDITAMELHHLRAQIAYVPQDSFVFSDTIAANVALARPGAPAADIRRYVATAALDGDVAEFRHGYDTHIGERGVTLSGGQKQRLCLARALLKDAPLLILDDCFSSLDASTAREIVASLRTDVSPRIMLVVSHRLETIRHADTILVLEGGQVCQSGTHAELMRAGGLYHRLYLTQQVEQNY